MIFTVHLNRLIDENTPSEQSTIELAYKKPTMQLTSTRKLRKFQVTSVRSIVTGLRHDDERDDDRSHRRVSIMSSLEAG